MADNVYYTISKGQGKVFHYSNSGANKTLYKYTGSSNILNTGIATNTLITTYSDNLASSYILETNDVANFLIASAPGEFLVTIGGVTFVTNYLFLRNLSGSIRFDQTINTGIATIYSCGLREPES